MEGIACSDCGLTIEQSKLLAGKELIPAVLFDGYAVYQSLSDETKKRTSPENVSDVLDAVVRLMRSNVELTGGALAPSSYRRERG